MTFSPLRNTVILHQKAAIAQHNRLRFHLGWGRPPPFDVQREIAEIAACR
jgi:hypothetical protein